MSADKSHYIEAAPARKAVALADYLQRSGVAAAEARYLSDAEKRQAETTAGVHVASEETWGVVYATLLRRERVSAPVLAGSAAVG